MTNQSHVAGQTAENKSVLALQWNCNGITSKKDELTYHISQHRPLILALQEIRLKPSTNLAISGYNVERMDGHTNYNSHGGVALCVHNSLPYTTVPLTTNIQAVAIRFHHHRLMTLCNIYSSRSHDLTVDSLNNLIGQLPSPFILLGDFNGYHTMWGSRCTDRRGLVIEKVISDNSLTVLNTGCITHIGHMSDSAIDLSIVSACLAAEFSWNTLQSPGDSDHIPIILTPLNHQSSQPITIKGWNIKKADWTKYNTHPEWTNLPKDIDHLDNNYLYKTFIRCINTVADATIPRYTYCGRYFPNPWWTPEVRTSYEAREQLYRKYRRRKTYNNMIRWKEARAKHKRLVCETKKESWRDLASSLTSSTPMTKIWDTVRRMKGKKPRSLHILIDGDEIYSTPQSIANKLASTFQQTSSTASCNPTFQETRKKYEQHPIDFGTCQEAYYNKTFSQRELQSILTQLKDKAPGPDGIFNSMITQLPETAKSFLLQLFNKFWKDSYYPEEWKLAYVIAIPKPGKDHSDPLSYRPIALTSNLCKLLERLINTRLVEYLEMENIITNTQSGCRKRRSTVDHLVALESSIRSAFARSEHFISIFFDISKAYDTTWRHGILRDLFDYGMRGRLPRFIAQFLHDRTFQVKIDDILSTNHEQECGVPQGGVLSVTLFAVKINGVADVIKKHKGILSSLYVDDLHIGLNSSDLQTMAGRLQACIDDVVRWADANGFTFSTAKTTAIHFNYSPRLFIPPDIHLYNKPIPYTETTKFLGLIWDTKLSWKPHVAYVKMKCNKVINFLRSVATHHWGADQTILIRLYRSFLRSIIDYGFIVYGNTSKQTLLPIFSTAQEALRIATGAFKTTPVCSLYILANEVPLPLRFNMLSLRYFFLLRSQLRNSTNDILSNTSDKLLFEHKKITPPFAIRVEDMLNRYTLSRHPIQPEFSHRLLHITIPSWSITIPKANLDLCAYTKTSTEPILYSAQLSHLLETTFKGFTPIYTDGSKSALGVGAAAVSATKTCMASLPKEANILTAELHAINMALTIISESPTGSYVILSDSKSSLLLLSSIYMENDNKRRIVHKIHGLRIAGKIVELCWIPSHTGILGNERADSAAKRAAGRPPELIPIPQECWRPLVRSAIYNEWIDQWQHATTQLKSIQPLPGAWLPPAKMTRREAVVLNRIRAGHSRLTHGYLMDATQDQTPPLCPFCNDALLTFPHIFLQCEALNQTRARYPHITNHLSLQSLFNQDCHTQSIIKYIIDINIFADI